MNTEILKTPILKNAKHTKVQHISKLNLEQFLAIIKCSFFRRETFDTTEKTSLKSITLRFHIALVFNALAVEPGAIIKY